MTYQNFDLRFEQRDSGYRVIADSPEGQVSTDRFQVPLSLQEPLGGADAQGAAADRVEVEEQRELGRDLYEALFRDGLRDLWERCSGIGPDGTRRWRRLRLHLEPKERQHAELAALPWELLHDGHDFLCLSRRTAVVRYVDGPAPTGPLPFEPPLNLLLATPVLDPRSASHLKSKEAEQVQQTWRDHDSVRLIVADPPAAHLLRSQLLDNEAHALHFIGHSGFEDETGKGYLLFEGRGRTGGQVSGEDLARIARDLPTLRLVVLNGCRTAEHRTGHTLAAVSGVAAALAQSGIGAVVANRFVVKDGMAALFGKTLHRHLAAGDSVEEAVTEGRIALRAEAPDELFWLAPVLFLRAEDGRLFLPRSEQEPVDPSKEQRSQWTDHITVADTEIDGGDVDVTGVEGHAEGDRTRFEFQKNRVKGDRVSFTGKVKK